MWSFWEKQSFIGKPDLIIIGSGIVGLTAALEYHKMYPSQKIMILEASHLPAGASTKNAGFACYGSPTEILADLQQDSEQEVVQLIHKRLQGLQNLRNLLGNDQIGYESHGSYELFTKNDKKDHQEVIEKLPYLNQLIQSQIGFTPFELENDIIQQSGFKNMIAAIKINGEGQIDTGKMMYNLLKLVKNKGIQIINGLKALSINSTEKGVEIITSQGNISSKKCIVTTNGFSKALFPEIDILPARAQVLITKPIKNLAFHGTFHFDSGYFYFRNVGNRVLFGGGRNLDIQHETTTINALNHQIQNILIEYLQNSILPDTSFEIEHQWTGIMGVGSTKQVIIQQMDKHIYAGIRLGGMGVAIGSLVGRDVARMI